MKEKLKCQLCGKSSGKSSGRVDTWIGGYLSHAHHRCADIGRKAIEMYLKWMEYVERRKRVERRRARQGGPM